VIFFDFPQVVAFESFGEFGDEVDDLREQVELLFQGVDLSLNLIDVFIKLSFYGFADGGDQAILIPGIAIERPQRGLHLFKRLEDFLFVGHTVIVLLNFRLLQMNPNIHLKFLKRTMTLAERGRGLVSPNPVVGAVLVRKGKIIAEDWHRKFGEGHAERNLLEKFDQKIRSTDVLYVSLEPCCHHSKKTSPCTDIILEKKVKKVVVGLLDPNPEVSGRGVKLLRKKGVKVDVVGMEELKWQNRFFFTWVKKRMPWVSLKVAQSLDGRIGKNRGEQLWLTGKETERHVHRMRAQYDAILVGVKTVIADNPKLTVRDVPLRPPSPLIRGKRPARASLKRQPVAVILDAALSVPLTSNVVRPGTIIFCGRQFRRRKSRKKQLIDKGCVVLEADTNEQGYLNLREILAELAARGIASVYVEGGPSVWSSFLEKGLANELMIYFAPRLLGEGVDSLETHGNVSVRFREMKVLGGDVYWQGSL